MKLTKENFLLYASQHYDNPNCESDAEFLEDLKHFKYLKRLVNKYVETGILKERLILNHVIVIYNIFGQEAGTKMIFLKMKGLEEYIKPFLVFLDRMPEKVDVDGKHLYHSSFGMNEGVVEALRKIR